MKEKDVVEYMRRVYDGEEESHKEPLLRPEGGTIYAFSYVQNPTKERDWRADGYRWRHNGVKMMTVGDLTLKKSYFNIFVGPKQNSREFQRIAHECTEYPCIVVIEYKGDHKIAGDFPHGNRRRDAQPHFMTMPSVVTACKTVKGRPKAIYENLTTSGDSIVSKPRDLYQIQNLQKAVRNKQRHVVEVLDVLREYSYDVRLTCEVIVEPELMLLLFNENVIEQFTSLLGLQLPPESQTVSVHRMIQFRNYIVVSLLYQNNTIGNSPFIPIMYFICNQNLKTAETIAWKESCRKISKLNTSKNVSFVTDVDCELTEDLQSYLQTACFRELISHLEDWDMAPVESMLYLQKNAAQLYQLSVHFARRVKGVDADRMNLRTECKDLFDASSGNLWFDGADVPRRRTQRSDHGLKNSYSDFRLENAASVDLSDIKLNPETRSFTVKDGSALRNVTLFPVETCDCGASGACTHIVACKISLGMFGRPKKRTLGSRDRNDDGDPNEPQQLTAHDNVLEVVEPENADDLDTMGVSGEITIADDIVLCVNDRSDTE